MKKSTAYHLAQIAVIQSITIATEDKLAIVRILMDDENLEAFVEKQNETAVEE